MYSPVFLSNPTTSGSPPVLSISLSDHSFSALASSFACTLSHSKPLWRFMFFSKRAFNALSSSSRCSGDKSFLLLLMFRALVALIVVFPRFLSVTPLRCATWVFFRLVFAFLSIRSFHTVRSAPVSISSLAAARRICVCPIFPQPPGIGRKISGASSTNAACCSSVSIRFPYPPACEASEANFLPPTRKAGNPAWEYSSTPSRLSAILRKSAAVIGRLPYVRKYLTTIGWHVSTAPAELRPERAFPRLLPNCRPQGQFA